MCEHCERLDCFEEGARMLRPYIETKGYATSMQIAWTPYATKDGLPATFGVTSGLLTNFAKPELVIVDVEPETAELLLERVAEAAAGGLAIEEAAERFGAQLGPIHESYRNSGLVEVFVATHHRLPESDEIMQLIPPALAQLDEGVKEARLLDRPMKVRRRRSKKR